MQKLIANVSSFNWLTEKVKLLNQEVNMTLKITDKMVSPYITATVRVEFEDDEEEGGINGKIEPKLACEKILRRLKKQNRNLSVAEWTIIDYWPTDRRREGIILKIRISLGDGTTLKKSGGGALLSM